MDFAVKHRGLINNSGKLVFDNTALFKDVVDRWRGKRFELFIREEENEISKDQHGYYFGGVLKTAWKTNQYEWMDKSEDLHYQVFAPKFLEYEKAIRTESGQIKIKKAIRGLSDLNQKEMAEFTQKVIFDLESDGIRILSPDEYEIAKRYKTTKK